MSKQLKKKKIKNLQIIVIIVSHFSMFIHFFRAINYNWKLLLLRFLYLLNGSNKDIIDIENKLLTDKLRRYISTYFSSFTRQTQNMAKIYVYVLNGINAYEKCFDEFFKNNIFHTKKNFCVIYDLKIIIQKCKNLLNTLCKCLCTSIENQNGKLGQILNIQFKAVYKEKSHYGVKLDV